MRSCKRAFASSSICIQILRRDEMMALINGYIAVAVFFLWLVGFFNFVVAIGLHPCLLVVFELFGGLI